jgi:hypothetical protein
VGNRFSGLQTLVDFAWGGQEQILLRNASGLRQIFAALSGNGVYSSVSAELITSCHLTAVSCAA